MAGPLLFVPYFIKKTSLHTNESTFNTCYKKNLGEVDAFMALLLILSRKANQTIRFTLSEKDFSSFLSSNIQNIFKVRIFSYG